MADENHRTSATTLGQTPAFEDGKTPSSSLCRANLEALEGQQEISTVGWENPVMVAWLSGQYDPWNYWMVCGGHVDATRR